jgi:phage gp46-like protein
MVIERFQGDPRIVIDEDGADLDFQAGQPVMDRGIENSVLLSLFTAADWVGNVLMDKPTQKYKGKFLEAIDQPINASALTDIRNAALVDLNWMLETGLAAELDASVSNPQSNTLKVLIVVKPPTSDLEVFLLTNNGLLWTSQTVDPANERLS